MSNTSATFPTRLGCEFEFRLAETPLFLPDDFKAKVVAAAEEIVAQLSDAKRLQQMKRAIRSVYVVRLTYKSLSRATRTADRSTLQVW